MTEPTLSLRMEKLEVKVQSIQSDMTEVKTGVKRLTDALTGDGMNKGVLYDLNVRIDENKSAIHQTNTHLQFIEGRILTADQAKKLVKLINIMDGWRGALIAIGAVVAFVYTALELISKIANL